MGSFGRLLVSIVAACASIAPTALVRTAVGQAPDPTKQGGSQNVTVLGHLAFDGFLTSAGVDMEQESSRPYVYVSGITTDVGFWVVSVAEPSTFFPTSIRTDECY